MSTDLLDLSELDSEVVEAACVYHRSVRRGRFALGLAVVADVVLVCLLAGYGETEPPGSWSGFAGFVASMLFVVGTAIWYGSSYSTRNMAFAWLLSARAATVAPPLPLTTSVRVWVAQVARAVDEEPPIR